MKKAITIFIIIIIFLTKGKTQEVKVVRDFRLRSVIGVEKNIFKRFEVYGEGAFELEKDISQLGKYFFETGLNYEPWKFLEINLEYRHNWNRKTFTDIFKQSNRFATHIEYSKKLDRLKLYLRVKYQTLDDDFTLYESDEKSEHILKNRIKLKYNLKGTKLSPFITAELYLASKNNFDPSRYRSFVGGEYEIKNLGEITIYYKYERELGSYVPYQYGTLGFEFIFKL